jgi:hypothetical protein
VSARTLALLLVLGLVAAGCASSRSYPEAIAHLDATYARDAATGQWTSTTAPAAVADELANALRAEDQVFESGTHYLRGREWIAAVRTAAAGTAIELDDYDTGYRRHGVFIAGFWGSRPGSYGPRSSGGGSGGGGFGVRGGGSGGGK